MRPMLRPVDATRWIGVLLGYLCLWFLWQTFHKTWFMPQTTNAVIPFLLTTSGLLPMLLILGAVLAHRTLVGVFLTEGRWKTVAWHLIHVALLLAVYAMCQRVGMDQFFHLTGSESGLLTTTSMITTMGNPLLTSNFLALVAPLCLMFKPQGRYLAYFLFLSLVIVLCGNTSSLIGVVCGSTTVLVLRRAWRYLLISGVLFVLGVLGVWIQGALATWLDGSQRLEIWTNGWQTLCAQRLWWTGLGLGSVASATVQRYWNYGTLHNDYLQLLFEIGGIGLGLVIASLVALGRQIFRAPMTTVLAAWCGVLVSSGIIAGLSFPLFVAPLAMVMWLAWTATTALTQEGGFNA